MKIKGVECVFLKSNVHLKEITHFLQEKFSEYVFKPDTQLNLIEIITRKNAEKEIEELKKHNDIAIDWDKVELEEVDNDK